MNRSIRSVLMWTIVTTSSIFGSTPPLTWSTISHSVYVSHPEIQKAALATKAASQNYHFLEASAAPNISAVLGTTQDLYGGTGSGISETLSISQPVFPTLFNRPDLDGAIALIQKSKADYSVTLASIRLDLATAYITLWASEQSVNLAQKIVNRRQKNLDLVTGRFEAGREHAGSKAWAGAQFESAKNDLVQAQRDVALTRRLIQILIGPELMPDITTLSISPMFSEMPAPPKINNILNNSAILQSVSANHRIKVLGRSSTSLLLLPSLSASFTAAQSGPISGSKASASDLGFKAQLSIPLFSGGADRLAEDIASTAVETASADYIAAAQTLESDLRQGWVDVQNASDNWASQLLFSAAAQTRSEIAAAQYSSGLLSYENWDFIETEVINQLRQVLLRQKTMALTIAKWDSLVGKELDQ